MIFKLELVNAPAYKRVCEVIFTYLFYIASNFLSRSSLLLEFVRITFRTVYSCKYEAVSYEMD